MARDPDDGITETELTARRARGALCLLVMADGAVDAHPLPERGEVTVGRGPACEVRVEHPTISRRHAVIRVGESGAITVEDAGSANGTFLRRQAPSPGRAAAPAVRLDPGRRAPVAPGDFIDLGSVLAFVWPSAPEAERRAGAHGETTAAAAAVRAGAMARLEEVLARVARGNISVLLLGETGVGKEVFAERVHRLSSRAGRPFVRLNCAALSESLLESELFGHERGAFTGAQQSKPGLLETAEGGTVLLDEVGELPLATQAKLLRVLQEREVMRVGGLRPRPIDVRFVAATNRDLAAEIARGAFREDLYFRLDGISLYIPPLRERVDEIAPLAREFAAQAARESGLARSPALGADALALLERYAWPGNVRQLRNVIERAVLLCRGDVIEAEHLTFGPDLGRRSAPPPSLPPGPPSLPPPPPRFAAERAPPPRATYADVRSAAADEERRLTIEALEQCGGNQSRAAEMLGISRRTLVYRITQYGLPRPRKR